MFLGNLFITMSFIVGCTGIVGLSLYIFYQLVIANKCTNISEEDIPSFHKVDKSMRNVTRLYSHKMRGSVRISNGAFYIDEEIDALRKLAFSKKLP